MSETEQNTIKRSLIVSIIINVVFFILFAGILFFKRNAIERKLAALTQPCNNQQPTEKVLKQFNNETLDAENGVIQAKSVSNKKISILFIGNSLTYCGVPEEEQDKRTRGMATTNINRDYVHVLLFMLSQTWNTNIAYSIANIADFERGFASDQLHDTTIMNRQIETWLKNCTVLYDDNRIKQKPDFVIIQIGENIRHSDVLLDNGAVLKAKYAELIDFFPGSHVIVTLPFWPDKDKINSITDIAVAACNNGEDVSIVDLSHLGTDSINGKDETNFAVWQRVSRGLPDYKQPGVGSHPGEAGMKKIAENLYTVIVNRKI